MERSSGLAHGDFGRVALLDMEDGLIRHAHPHCHLILKVDGPDQQFEVDGVLAPLSRDMVVLVNSWQPHRYVPRTDGRRSRFVALYIDPAWIGGLDRVQFNHAAYRRFLRCAMPIAPAQGRVRDDLADALSAPAISSGGLIETLTAQLLAGLLHHQLRAGRWVASPDASRSVDFRIRRTVRAMGDAVVRSDADLDGFARIAGLSRPRFNELFRLGVGVSPGLYLRARTVEMALKFLVEERQKVHTVAATLGFSAPENFTRFIRLHTGMVPKDLRRMALDNGSRAVDEPVVRQSVGV